MSDSSRITFGLSRTSNSYLVRNFRSMRSCSVGCVVYIQHVRNRETGLLYGQLVIAYQPRPKYRDVWVKSAKS